MHVSVYLEAESPCQSPTRQFPVFQTTHFGALVRLLFHELLGLQLRRLLRWSSIGAREGFYLLCSLLLDTLIGQAAEIGSACPEWAAVMGRRKRAGAMRTGRGKISTERASGSSRGADMPRWIASSSSLRRRTWGTRNSVAGWMTPLTTLAFLMLGTPLTHVGRQGGGPSRGA